MPSQIPRKAQTKCLSHGSYLEKDHKIFLTTFRLDLFVRVTLSAGSARALIPLFFRFPSRLFFLYSFHHKQLSRSFCLSRKMTMFETIGFIPLVMKHSLRVYESENSKLISPCGHFFHPFRSLPRPIDALVMMASSNNSKNKSASKKRKKQEISSEKISSPKHSSRESKEEKQFREQNHVKKMIYDTAAQDLLLQWANNGEKSSHFQRIRLNRTKVDRKIPELPTDVPSAMTGVYGLIIHDAGEDQDESDDTPLEDPYPYVMDPYPRIPKMEKLKGRNKSFHAEGQDFLLYWTLHKALKPWTTHFIERYGRMPTMTDVKLMRKPLILRMFQDYVDAQHRLWYYY